MDSILSYISKEHLKKYLFICSQYTALDIEHIYEVTLDIIRRHKGISLSKLIYISEFIQLEDKWYRSLEKGKPDYSIYAHPLYFSELWICWIIYSRKYLKIIQLDNSLSNQSIVSDIQDCKSVLDLGCGVGFTTQALTEIFKEAIIIGTNLSNTPQFRLAKERSKLYRFIVQEKFREADLIFASEYFEHIENPIEHLIEVLIICKPKYLLLANSFNTKALGHFIYYKYNKQLYTGSEISRIFNKILHTYGYLKVKTNCWNNRPSYWKRIKSKNKTLL